MKTRISLMGICILLAGGAFPANGENVLYQNIERYWRDSGYTIFSGVCDPVAEGFQRPPAGHTICSFAVQELRDPLWITCPTLTIGNCYPSPRLQ